MNRAPATARVAAVSPSQRFDQLVESAAGFARSGPAEALMEVLREADRLIARQAERLDTDAGAAPALRRMQQRLTEVSLSLECEQQRIVRDLAALQQSAQTDGRYGPPQPIAIALDRRG